MYLRYSRVRDVEVPKRPYSTDAGIDFYVPNDFEEVTLLPGESVNIPSGIKVEIPIGYMGLFLNKSGIATKYNLIVGAQCIDTFYTGEVHINLHNIGDADVKIKPGMKIIQMVIIPVICCGLQEVSPFSLNEDFSKINLRNEKGFGSTSTNKEMGID